MRFSSQDSSIPSNRSRFHERNVIHDPDLDFLDRAQFEEMYDEKDQRRSRSRERKRFCNSKGNDRFSLHTRVPKTAFDCYLEESVPVHECSFDLKYKHTSSKKNFKSPIKAKKEVSKEKENEKAPTNLIARLMGLDPLPRALDKQQKGRRPSSQKTPYPGIHNMHSNKKVEYTRMSNNKYQEFKDVYEIMEKPRFEHHDDALLQKETLSLKSSEFNDALKDIDCDHNSYSEFIQEQNLLLMKHLQGLQSSLNPYANQITILKPSSKFDKEICDISERKSGHPVKEHRCSIPYKSSPPYKGKINDRYQSAAEIVVLKPSLEKAWNFKVVEKSNLNNFSDSEKQQFSKSKKLYNAANEDYHKGLREIARDVTKQLRIATAGSDKITGVKISDFSHHLNNFSDSRGASSYCPTESKVSREAKKHLSQRYKKVQQTQAKGIDSKGMCTLEDLLVHDREKSRNAPNHSNIWNHEKMEISSKEVRKERKLKSLSMSTSLPASFSVSDNSKQHKRNRVAVSDSISLQSGVLDANSLKSSTQSLKTRYPNSNAQLHSCGEDIEIHEKEIHVHPEELHSTVHSIHNSKEHCMDDDDQFGDVEGQVNAREIIIAEATHDETKEVDHNDANHISSQYEVSESLSSACLKEDQPTPVSVLESTSFEEDQSSPECFEKISANLKELRMQLRLLKLESADTDDECELVISSDEDSDGECNSKLNSSEPMLEAFKSDEDREHHYLHDVVSNSNAHPPDNELFEKLEEKYSKLSSWSRSERKLLFDVINSSMFDPLSMKLNKPCPENIVEEIWQFLLKQRMEVSGKIVAKVDLDPGWFVSGENLDVIARELEKMLVNDLIEELI